MIILSATHNVITWWSVPADQTQRSSFGDFGHVPSIQFLPDESGELPFLMLADLC